jgi:UDP-N-acetylmuramoyl-tripeptide--D-alanyl-D-alanine ligase
MDPTAIEQIAAWTGGSLSGRVFAPVNRVVTDSKAVQPGDLFVALKGERFDGHDFLTAVRGQGAVAALVQRGRGERPSGLALVEVEDTLSGLQKLAASWRQTLPARVVGVTGSSGKTSTKDFAHAILSTRLNGWSTQGNLNNHIGVPLTLLAGNAQDSFAVVEMGMNHAGEIAPLAAMARPEVGIITNIGVAHIEYLGSREAIAREKGSLVAALPLAGTAVLPAEDDFLAVLEQLSSGRILTAGLGRGDVQAVDIVPVEGGSRFALFYEGQRVEVELGVAGLHMVRNVALAAAAAVALDLPLETAAEGLRGMRLTKGRMERRSIRGVEFLDDTYNANPDSMKAALATLAHWPARGRRIAVLGRMGELGAYAREGHDSVGRAAGVGIDRLLTVGSEAEWIAAAAREAGCPEVSHFEDTGSAAYALSGAIVEGDVVLVKGSRSARMEQVIEEVARL